jgi:hypothetical protein
MLKPKHDDWHLLYQGELSDVPGRCESFYEYVRYLSEDKWELVCLGSEFSGIMPTDPQSDKMSSEDLVNWVFWQDEENDPGTEFGHVRNTDDKDEEGEHAVLPGPRATKLTAIAELVGCEKCKRLLRLRCEGSE